LGQILTAVSPFTSLGGSTSFQNLTIQQNLLTVQQNLITQQQTIDSYFQGVSDLVVDEERIDRRLAPRTSNREGRTQLLVV